MSNEKHYDYYITSKEVKDIKLNEHKEKFGSKRSELIKEFCDKHGALGYTLRSSWGGADLISELVFDCEHDIVSSPYHKKRAVMFEGKSCFAITGKGNRKDGISFNNEINDINDQIKDIPNFTDWIVDEFKVMRTGMGESTGRGVAMLQTAGGIVGDYLGFRIPNCKQDCHGLVEIPDCFEKISYGQWYDLINGK